MFDNLETTPFVVFDIETTGLDYRMGNQVIELAAQKIVNHEIVDQFHFLINPTVPIEDGAYNVHGLSNLFLSTQGKQAHEVFPQFLEFSKDTILVGHNILNFDIPFLNNDLKRLSFSPLENLVVDTLIMARKILPSLPNHKLGTVASHFGVDPAGAHRAMVDVEMNKKVFLKMLTSYVSKIKEEEQRHSKAPSASSRLF